MIRLTRHNERPYDPDTELNLDDPSPCPACQGTGMVKKRLRSAEPCRAYAIDECTECGGTGFLAEE